MAPVAGGRHTSMHEYLASGIDGINVGVGGFSQGNPANFQDIINSSQKVSVPQNMIQGSQIQQQDADMIANVKRAGKKMSLNSRGSRIGSMAGQPQNSANIL